MRGLVTLVVFWLLAGPALALSCMPYGVTDAFLAADGSQSDYIVVHGRLDFDAANLPATDWDRQDLTPPETLFAGRLSGRSLTRAGFTAPFESTIAINVQCFGPWCSSLAAGADYLAFLKREGGGYLLETNPCGGFAFGAPSREMLDAVVSCFQGGRCEPSMDR